jgi:F-type H+-transporting ATPase subunit epsilon
VTPEREVWAGEADFVIARSVAGDIGILPGHAPTLAALDVGPVIIDAGGQRTTLVVDGGFLHVAHEGDVTRVDILAEHAVASDELAGGDDAESRERRAEELRSEDRLDEAREERAKAAVRRRVAEGG